MSLYPANFPVSEGFEVVAIVKAGEIVAKKDKFAYNLWLLQGFAQKTVFGEPGAPVTDIAWSSAVKPENFDAVNELEKICQAQKAGAVTSQSLIPWQLILKWALEELVKMVATAA